MLVEGGSVRGQLVLGEEGGGGVQTSLGGLRIGRRANLLQFDVCIFRCIESCCIIKAENRCIRRYTRTRIASQPSRAIQLYSAIQRYTTLCIVYSYTALYTIQPLATPLWASVSITEALVGGRRGREPPSDT